VGGGLRQGGKVGKWESGNRAERDRLERSDSREAGSPGGEINVGTRESREDPKTDECRAAAGTECERDSPQANRSLGRPKRPRDQLIRVQKTKGRNWWRGAAFRGSMGSVIAVAAAQRGKPAWRKAMRDTPVAEKLRLLEQAILEARHLERIKSEWKKSAKSSSSLLPAGR